MWTPDFSLCYLSTPSFQGNLESLTSPGAVARVQIKFMFKTRQAIQDKSLFGNVAKCVAQAYVPFLAILRPFKNESIYPLGVQERVSMQLSPYLG